MLQSEHAVRGAIRTDTQCARIPESRDGRDIEGHVQKHKRSGLQHFAEKDLRNTVNLSSLSWTSAR